MNVIALITGGFIGTLMRYFFGILVPPLSNGFPLGTLLINLLGCFFLGWFFTITTIKWKIRPEIRLGIGTGFTGAFTTFSTFSIETDNLILHSQYGLATVYVLLSVVIGIALTGAGVKLARPKKLVERRAQ